MIADYLEAQETGQPPDRANLLQKCPDLAAELALFSPIRTMSPSSLHRYAVHISPRASTDQIRR